MMHVWGDDWFEENGEDLGNAIHYCIDFWKKWGRIGSHGKEKWGRFDQYLYFWDGSLFGLIWPGYVSTHGFARTFIYWYFDRYFFQKFTRLTGLCWLGRRWQKYIYFKALNNMANKYPNIKEELCIGQWDPWSENE